MLTACVRACRRALDGGAERHDRERVGASVRADPREVHPDVAGYGGHGEPRPPPSLLCLLDRSHRSLSAQRLTTRLARPSSWKSSSMSTSAGVHVCTAKGSHVCQWGSQVRPLSRSLALCVFLFLSRSDSLSHSLTHSVWPSDIPRQRTVKIFCPKCDDIYFPKQSRHMSAQRTDSRSCCRRRLERSNSLLHGVCVAVQTWMGATLGPRSRTCSSTCTGISSR